MGWVFVGRALVREGCQPPSRQPPRSRPQGARRDLVRAVSGGVLEVQVHAGEHARLAHGEVEEPVAAAENQGKAEREAAGEVTDGLHDHTEQRGQDVGGRKGHRGVEHRIVPRDPVDEV
jgi:hypothetical protein